jgi:hypothetical protein
MAILLCMLLLTACTDSAHVLHFKALPKELADCETYRLSNADGYSMIVMRCPNSSASLSYRVGKKVVTAVTVDGAGCPPSKK